ncbi:MAG: DNA translocase FtsK [Desulfobacterium sp.]
MNILEKNSYKIDNDVLTIRSLCGEYSFKVEDSGSTDNIHHIAQMMVSELVKAEESIGKAGVSVNPHVLVLLANLNLSKKYVEMRDRLETLTQTLEKKTRSLGDVKPKGQQQVSQEPIPNTTSPTQPKPSVTKMPLASDTAGNYQKANTSLSDPILNKYHGPSPESEKTNIPSPPRAKAPEPSKVSEPSKVPEPVKIPAPMKTRERVETPLRSKSSTTDSPLPTKEPGQSLQAPPMSEAHRMHQAAPPSVQKTVPTAPEFPGTSSSEVSNSSPLVDIPPEAQDAVPEIMNAVPCMEVAAATAPMNEIPNATMAAPAPASEVPNAAMTAPTSANEVQGVAMTEPDPINEVPDVEMATPVPASKAQNVEMRAPETENIHTATMPANMETSYKATESDTPPAKIADPQQQDTMEETSMLKTSGKQKISCHELPAAMGSFPIHTAVTYSHSQTNDSPSMEEESTEETYQLPSLGFLKNINSKTEVDHESIRRDAELLEKKLGYFGIKGEVMGVSPGPVITTFEYKPDPGIKISKIVNLADDLALALSAYSIRIVAPIPGKDVMGIEIPNLKKSIVPFIDIVSSEDFINCPSKLPICLGKDIIGNPVVVQLESMPHLLIAGATGTGKSVGLNAMITSILYRANPDEVKFLMIDPKRIELSLYNDIPHLITPVITDMKKATTALQWMVREMERRYDLLAKYQVRNIEQFNQKIKGMDSGMGGDDAPPEPLSYIVIIIDELADLMMTASRDVELSLTRLAQMARAAGIHLILATQRPSVDVLTGIIKANFPTRISFQVSSKTDSRTIIDSNGAETLLGMGDMLFVPPGTSRLTRVHGTYLSEEELIEITTFLKAQQAPDYLFDVITEQQEEPEQDNQNDEYDEKYQDALEVVMTTRQASISGIQRALRVGYNRAARIIDIMEKKGIVGPSDGAKPRQVLRGPMD